MSEPLAASVLVIDDTPQNLDFMSDLLRERGYRVRVARGGTAAMRSALRDPPDLVLLDVCMPDIDGYEVCRRLKAEATLRDVPVIFVSALNESVDKVDGLRAGGVDYITKPVDRDELVARMQTHLALREARIALERRTHELATANARLTELEELRRKLGHMLVHDMRGPLTVILTHASMLAESATDEDERCDCNAIVTCTKRLAGMVDDLLDVARLEEERLPLDLAPSALDDLASAAISTLAPDKRAKITVTGASAVSCDRVLVERVFMNLIGNALKYGAREGPVCVTIEKAGAYVRTAVTDRGPGIPVSEQSRIFDLFAQMSTAKRRGWGIGLSFCRLAIEAHGGEIGVESRPGEGSSFWFTLPSI